MKITLEQTQFSFNPALNLVSFDNMTGIFKPERLLAVINTNTGKLIYSAASQPSGFGGTFANGVYANSQLTYASSNSGQSPSDILQCLYDDNNAQQQISGAVTTYVSDANGNPIGSVSDPISGDYKLLTASNTYAGDGTPILSTVDPVTGNDGLNTHLQSSTFGGQLGNPLPSAGFGYQGALSVGFLNGSVLSAPKMDPVTNELIVQTSGTHDVNVTKVAGTAISVNAGPSDAGTIRVVSNQYASNGTPLDYGNGQITPTSSQRISLGDYSFSGAPGATLSGRNIITNSTSSNDLNGYRYFSIQIICSATAGTFIFETSNDDLNWQPLAVSNQSLTTGVIITSAITATASSFIYVGTMTGRYLRIRIVTTLTGGTAQAECRFSQVAPLANNVTISSGSASTVAPNIDVLGSAVSGSRYNQIEIDFNTAPSGSLLTTTVTGSGTITQSNGHSLFATSSTATSSAKGVSVGIVQYRAANELYSYFSAAFTVSGGARTGSSYQRIGIYDTNNGFFIGYSGLNFGVTKRTGGADTFTVRTAWNGDLLDGNPASKFTRNNIPEAIDFTKSNLFRIRFAWLGSACILFDVYSPDGIWVNYHTIKQPNIDFNPSLTVPNLPMTIDCAKNSSGSEILTIATACWAGGTSSSYSPITATLTDNSLAALNRSVITGVTTGGGGGYVNVKVNPSGALVTDSTISGTVASNISQYGGTSTTLGQKVMTASMPVVLASDQSTISALLPDLYLTGQSAQTATINNILPATASANATDVSGYRTGSVQVVSTGTGGSFIFEGSNDNSNFQAIPVLRQDISNASFQNSAITPAASAFIYTFPVSFRYIRLRISATITGGSIQAFSRFSQATWTAGTMIVHQPTGSNLNTQVTQGTAANLQATVSQATAANLNCTAVVSGASLLASATTDLTSATLGAGSVNSNFVATTNLQSSSFAIYVTAVSGTPTFDVDVQETMDGTSYYTIYSFERITTTGQFYSPVIKHSGSGVRYVRTVGGGSPSVTNSVVRISRQGQADAIKRFINRTIVPNTLSSNTGSFFCEGVNNFNLAVRCTAQTTPATIALEFSIDGTNWFTSTASVTTAVGIVQAKITNEQWKFVRATVTAAGTGITLDSVTIGGYYA
jgi:hypothetical protein